MRWLLSTAGRSLTLANDRRALQALATLAPLVESRTLPLPQPSTGLPDPGNLPSWLVNLDPTLHQELLAMLKSRGIALAGKLAENGQVLSELLAMLQTMRRRLPELGILGCSWSGLLSGACGGGERTLHWHGLDRVPSGVAGPIESRLRFALSGETERALTFEPVEPDREPLPVAIEHGVRLRLGGRIETDASLEIPIRLGSLGLSSQNQGEIRIEWLLDRGQDPCVAETFAACLGELVERCPFDLQDLDRGFQGGRLRALTIDAAGALGIGGSLSLAVTGTLFAGGVAAPGIDANLGVKLGFYTSRAGTYRVAVFPDVSPRTGRHGIRVDIHRTRVATDTNSVSLGLTLDLSRALEGLRGELINQAKGAADLLVELQQLIPPSAAIRTELTQWVMPRIGSPELRQALTDVLGSSASASATDRLIMRLASALDAQADLWNGPIDAVAAGIANRLMSSLNLDGANEPLLRSVATQVSVQAVHAVRARLQEEVRLRAASATGLAQFKAALDSAENQTGSALDWLDDLGERASRQMAGFQTSLAGLAAALVRSTQIKLDLRWRSEERRASGRTIDQSLFFAPEHQEAQGLFQRALTGSLDDVFAQLAGRTTTPMDPVELIAGTLQEVASLERKSGFELTLLDFQLGSGSLLDADVVVETDASGNVRVCTKALSRWRRWRPGESLELESVNVFELATASRTRHMSLSVSLNQVDEDLKIKEVQEFFRGLAADGIGLLRHDELERLLARLQERDLKRGELKAWIELGETELLRLLRISDPRLGLPGNPLLAPDEVEIFDTAIDAMVAGMRATGSQENLRAVAGLLGVDAQSDDLPRLLKSLRTVSASRFAPHPGDDGAILDEQGKLKLLEHIAERAAGLVAMIQAMRRLYFSTPGPGWGIAEYQRLQREIDSVVIRWAKGEPVGRGWWALFRGSNTIGPFLLAYFKAITELCRYPRDAAARAPCMAAILLPAVEGDEEIRLVDARDEPLPYLPPRPLMAFSPPLVAPPAGTSGPQPQEHDPGTQVPATELVTPEPFVAAFTTRSDPGPNRTTRSKAMTDFIFPLERRVQTYHTGGTRYGALRDGGRLHAGCDLKVPPGTQIRAMADGVVVRGPYYFYSNTYALEIEHHLSGGKTCLVRYGEINQKVAAGIKAGSRVEQGQPIATVGRLKSGSSMLHLEMYRDGSSHQKLTVAGFNKFKRRKDLMDPTTILDAAPLTPADGILSAPSAAATQAPTPTSWPGTVNQKVPNRLVVRAEPRILLGATPRARLHPGDLVEVVSSVSGGAYPFGLGNLWLKVRYRRDASGNGFIDDTGFVVAYFIDTPYPIAGTTGLPGDAGAPGFVSRLETGLNVRDAPDRNARVVELLPLGHPVKVLRQVVGGDYGSGRNDWLQVEFHSPSNQTENAGYAAAFFIDVGEPQAHDVVGSDRDNLNPWEQVLVSTEWGGCSDATSWAQMNLHGGGAEASKKIAALDVDAVKAMAGVFHDVAAKFGLPAALLAGIASRESHVGRSLQGGWGDRGNGFGVMQVDRNAHRIQGQDPRGIEHVTQAAGIFAKNLEIMTESDRYAGWGDRYLLLGATAAYNFGIGNVRTKEKIDIGTTGGDYGSDTLARAKYFYLHPDLHELRD